MAKSSPGRKRTAVIIAVLIVLLIAAFWPFPVVRTYRVSSGRIETPIRIALLSDLHSSAYGANQAGILSRLERIQPDIVLLCGDIMDEKADPAPAKTLLTQLGEAYEDCFYVTGNHEFWSGNAKDIKKLVREAGIRVLDGGYREVGAHNQLINICGTDDPDVDEDAFYKQLRKAASCNFDHYSILLTHRPERIDDYREYDFDLILTGHTHGGQWRLPPLINGVYAPNQSWLPRYGGGRYDFDGATMIVSRGLDKTAVKFPRLFNPPEIVLVEIY